MIIKWKREKAMNKIIESDMREIAESNVQWGKFRGKTVLISGATGMIPSYMVMILLYLNKMDLNFKCKVIAQVRNIKKALALFGDFIFEPYLEFVQSDICTPVPYKGGGGLCYTCCKSGKSAAFYQISCRYDFTEYLRDKLFIAASC